MYQLLICMDEKYFNVFVLSSYLHSYHTGLTCPCSFSSCSFYSGEGALNPNDPNRDSTLSQQAKTEISLTLTSKCELLEGDDKDVKTLMTK